MRIEILHVSHCPNLPAARSSVEDALRKAGVTAIVEETEVLNTESAQRFGMHGSPTILIDGHDPFLVEGESSLACRLYRTGDLAHGAPSVAELVVALSR